MSDDRQARMSAAAAAAWDEARPRIMGRLAALEAAAAAVRAGAFDVEMRRNAEGEAHKLAGSLGMFGFARGGEIAREIEERLEGDGPLASDVTELIDRLVDALPAQ